ncbi:type VI secretion system Vgr family protein [Aquimarina sp. RZ0]|uniref:type VI secretion system Vgr family protein n=1 Tax=Aquimarina sp. RZ0 TaxID=2607730 RepID=UPI0011F29CFA|nr:phage baseplate assembly protein V [Aquimarina sp. RZ0]KAA1244506.1 hypothetical protein F0000_16090 [Aquimarina sp. RZ0]
MALQTTVEISLAGTIISAYKSISIKQELASHHKMELRCRMDVLEDMKEDLASSSKDFLGETVILRVASASELLDYQELRFKGLVTSVNMTKGFHQQGGDLVNIEIKGCSILADDGAHFTSFSEMDLTTILNNTYTGYDVGKLETSFNPSLTETLLYSVCSNESAFAYTRRLATQYGEWFYYDGKALVFGLPQEAADPITLSYGINLMQFSLNLQPLPNSFKYVTSDYITGDFHQSGTKEVASNTQGHVNYTSGKSEEIFGKESTVFLHGYEDAQSKQRLDNQVAKQKNARENSQVVISGVSDNPGVQLGSVVQVKDDTKGYGSFRITEVFHELGEGGRYSNTFKGVSADISAYPLTDILASPKSGTQVAKVYDNADPEGLGRIKCQFFWQLATGQTTPWIRVLTPHAGADKGFHMLPEVSEEVLIGFEGNSAERPYVMGSLYNGAAYPSEWQTDKNNLKVQRTRAGHTMIFDDSEGKEELTIYDKDQNSIIKFKSHTQSLDIFATEDLNLTAKNINIQAEENINIQAKQNVETAAEGDIKTLAQGTIASQSDGDTQIKSKSNMDIEASSDTKITGTNVVSEAKSKAELKGAQTKVAGQMTEVKGAAFKIDVK